MRFKLCLGYLIRSKNDIGFKWSGNFGFYCPGGVHPDLKIKMTTKKHPLKKPLKIDTIFETRFFWYKKFKFQKKLFNIKKFFLLSLKVI